MARAVLFVPRADMISQAEKLAGQYRLDFLYMKMIPSTDAAEEAAAALAAGAEMIIARGLTATEIKKCVQIPVVEIMLTGQELGQIVIQAKRDLGISNPKIGVVGFRNMFCDMTSFNAMYDIELHEYYVEQYDQLVPATLQAYDDGMDAVIGGVSVFRRAKELGRPVFFLASGEESIAEAFRVAEQVSYASDMEKKNTALFKTLLDYSFNGIIQIGPSGDIEHVNHLAEKLLEMSERDLQGSRLTDLIPDISESMLEQVLQEGREIYSTVLLLKRTALVANLAPLTVDGLIQGAILSFQEGQKITELETEMRRGLYRAGHVAKNRFDDLVTETAQSREMVDLARRYAKFRAPVLIFGDRGTEKEMLAQSIHQASMVSGGPYVSLSCDSLPQEELTPWLFGSEKQGVTPYAPKGLVDMAEGGTLFLDHVSRLDSNAQYRLYRLVLGDMLIRAGDIRTQPVRVRVIAADGPELPDLVEQGLFRQDLYDALNILPLHIVPFRHRKPDVVRWIERFIDELEKKHERYIRLTAGALKMLEELPWDGNLIEIHSFCERLVIQAPRRSVDELIVRQLLQQSERRIDRDNQPVRPGPRQTDDLKARISQSLALHKGNRRLAAQSLNISTTTLWRYMKRY